MTTAAAGLRATTARRTATETATTGTTTRPSIPPETIIPRHGSTIPRENMTVCKFAMPATRRDIHTCAAGISRDRQFL